MLERKTVWMLLVLWTVVSAGCRKDEVVYLSDGEYVTLPMARPVFPEGGTWVKGFYQLNEGNMGMNRATIDYFDYETGLYTRDIYSERNPEVVKELGDVGNDIQIYGGKVYAVINCSNYIEVIDVATARHVGSIQIPNCRYIVFHEGKAYVSSYSGKVAIDPNAEIGFVAEIDTLTLELTRKVTVGYQPEEMVIHDGKLYVANSGGYRVPDYDRTVSVVDLETFKKIKDIDVAINLHRMEIDGRGNIYVSSRGDYYDVGSNLFVIDTDRDEVAQVLGVAVSDMCLSGDSLYFYGTEWSHYTGRNTVTYGIIDTRTRQMVSDRVIKDGTDREIMMPYGIAVNPYTKEIFVTDAQNYVVTGYVYCFSPEGRLKWKTQGGNIPGHFAFVEERIGD